MPIPAPVHTPVPPHQRLLLALGSTAQDGQALVAALRSADPTSAITVQAADCIRLVQEVAYAAPQQVIAYLPRGAAALLLAMAAWKGAAALPRLRGDA